MAGEPWFGNKAFILKRLEILPPDRDPEKPLDITYLMNELSIFEDIHSPVITGAVSITDTYDLIHRLPMRGFETLVLTFTKPGAPDKDEIVKRFRIYKIDNVAVSHDNLSSQSYLIMFCSEEQIISQGKLISKSYKGKSAGDIVSDIIKNQLKVPGNRIVGIDTTKEQYNIIVPSLYPLEAIQLVSLRTKPACLFYENTKGFVFTSIEKLMKKSPVVSYRFAPKNVSEDINPDTQYGSVNVIKYEYMSVFDVLEAISNGMFAGGLKTIDLLRQKVSDYEYSYKKEFTKSIHLEDKPVGFDNDSKDRLGKTISDYKDAFRRFYPTTKEHDTNSNISSKNPGIKQNLVEQWLLNRASAIEQLHYMRLKLSVPGNIYVTVGEVIGFGVPSITSKLQGGEDLENKYNTGRYLITAAHHVFNPTGYITIIEATKDSLGADYPTGGDIK